MRLLRNSLIPSPLFHLEASDARSRHHAQVRVEINPVLSAGSRWRVLQHGLVWLLRLIWLQLRGQLTPRSRGRITRELLEALGGLWIKPGQILASRRDILHADFCDELSKLHEKVVGFSPEVAIRIIEDQLNAPISQIFDDFQREPFAAASVGQLHRAVLRKTGIMVAIKVQRPNLQESLIQDMKFIRAFAKTVEWLRLSPHIYWNEMANELNKILTEELDFRYEASNITRMRRTLRKEGIYVPKLFQRYCTRRMIVMEFISGVSMADYITAVIEAPQRLAAWLVENQIEPRRVGHRLFFSVYRQLLEDNLFHGDLHPGNILLLKNSRLAFIDFGTVGILDAGFHKKYVMLHKAFTEGDYSRAVDMLLLLFPPLPKNIGQPRKEMITVIQAHQMHASIKEIPYPEKTVSALVGKLTAVFSRYQIPAGMDFMRIDRTMLALDASLMHLCPHENMVKLTKRYWKKATQREQKRLLYQQKASLNSNDVLTLVVEGPKRVSEMLFLQGEMVRGQARILQDKITKFSYLLSAIASTLRMVMAVALLWLFGGYLAQHHRPLAASLMTPQTLELVDQVPYLDHFLWLIVLMANLYLITVVMILNKRAVQPEAQD